MSKMRDIVLGQLNWGAKAVNVPPHLAAECDLPTVPGIYQFETGAYRMTIVDGWASWELIEDAGSQH